MAKYSVAGQQRTTALRSSTSWSARSTTRAPVLDGDRPGPQRAIRARQSQWRSRTVQAGHRV